MSQQNLLGIGFNVAELDAQSKQVEKIVVDLYNTLKQYDNVKLSPVDVTGLQQLTNSIQQQQTQINNLVQSVNSLGTAMINYNSTLATTNTTAANAATAINNSTSSITGNTNAINANTSATGTNITSAQRLAQQLGRNALAENDLLKQMKLRRAELEKMYSNAALSGASKPEQAILFTQLRDVNRQINTVETSLERAGSSGIAGLSRGLGSVLGNVRQLAYILPGVGMAGLFNLAFEAIGAVIQQLGFFDDAVSRSAEYVKKLADNLKDFKDTLYEINNLHLSSDVFGVDDAKKALADAVASGKNYTELLSYKKAVLDAEKKLADDRVAGLGASQEALNKINDDIYRLDTKRLGQLQTVKNLSDKIFETQGKSVTEGTGQTMDEILSESTINPQKVLAKIHDITTGIVPATIEKALDVHGYTSELEIELKKLTALDAQLTERRNTQTKTEDALKSQKAANNNIDAKALEDSKYFSDEERKIRLDNAINTAEGIKAINEATLKNQTKSEKEKLDAINAIEDANVNEITARYNNVSTKIGVTEAERNEALNQYNLALKKNAIKASEDSEKIVTEFWTKRNDITHKSRELDILIQQLADKTVLDNEQESYQNRMNALIDYTNDRERVALEQYQSDVLAANLLPQELRDLKLIQLKKEYDKQILDAENGLRKESYDIAENWYRKQLDLVKDANDVERTEAQNAATDSLLTLTEQYNKKEISHKEFLKRREKLEHESDVKIANARVADDESELARLIALRDEVSVKLNAASSAFSIASMFGSKRGADSAQGEIDDLTKDYNDLTHQIGTKNAEYSKDKLTAAELYDKKQDEMRKRANENWQELEKDGFDIVKEATDAYYEYRLNKIQELADAQDEAIEHEIDAINRSTISAKEKNAYDIQLQAEKTASDEKFAKEQRKIKHDQAIFDRDIALAQMELNIALSITEALATGGPAAIPLAISYGALGAAALIKAVAVKIPEYATGGTHQKDGLAIFGEAGHELVKEPNKKPFVATKPTLGYLAAGTELIPLYDIPSFSDRPDNSWAQTLYLGKQIAKNKHEIKNIFKPKISVNLYNYSYTQRILHGKG